MQWKRNLKSFLFLSVLLTVLFSDLGEAAKKRGKRGRNVRVQNQNNNLADLITLAVVLQNPDLLNLGFLSNLNTLQRGFNFNLNGLDFGNNSSLFSLDPSLNNFNSNGFNPFFNRGLGFNDPRFPGSFGNSGSHGIGPFFGDKAIRTSARSLSNRLSGSLCGDAPEQVVCARIPNPVQVERQIEGTLSQQVKNFLSETGTPASIYQQRLSLISSQGAVPSAWQSWYAKYLDKMKGDLDIKELTEQQKKGLIESLADSGFQKDKTQWEADIRTAKIVDRPDLNDPVETAHFIKACGASNTENNAFACPFHGAQKPLRIFLCGGRKAAAVIRAQGDLSRALADLSHTLAHELGHLVGPETYSPYQSALADVSRCNAQATGQKDKSDFATSGLNSEIIADQHAAQVLAKNISNRQTQGLSNEEYVIHSLERLCGTEGDNDHLSGADRIRNALKSLKQDNLAREILKCGRLHPSEMVCKI